MNLLITLRPAKAVDMGRWILQHHGVPYKERPHAPIFHILALKWWGGGDKDYPLMVTDKREILKGNAEILTYVEKDLPNAQRLVPTAEDEPELHKEVPDFTGWLYGEIRSDVVKYSYYYLLKHKAAVWPSLTTGVPWYEKVVWFIAFPLMRALMYAGLGLDKAKADTALVEVRKTFDKIDGMLADGRQYLMGGRLTYADIAVAAFYAPMILGQGYQGFLPNQAACPPDMAKVYQEFRQRPTGLYIQRMYDLHRPPE